MKPARGNASTAAFIEASGQGPVRAAPPPRPSRVARRRGTRPAAITSSRTAPVVKATGTFQSAEPATSAALASSRT
jgi:hypothetical protein